VPQEKLFWPKVPSSKIQAPEKFRHPNFQIPFGLGGLDVPAFHQPADSGYRWHFRFARTGFCLFNTVHEIVAVLFRIYLTQWLFRRENQQTRLCRHKMQPKLRELPIPNQLCAVAANKIGFLPCCS
jgi:hypothetical protein